MRRVASWVITAGGGGRKILYRYNITQARRRCRRRLAVIITHSSRSLLMSFVVTCLWKFARISVVLTFSIFIVNFSLNRICRISEKIDYTLKIPAAQKRQITGERVSPSPNFGSSFTRRVPSNLQHQSRDDTAGYCPPMQE